MFLKLFAGAFRKKIYRYSPGVVALLTSTQTPVERSLCDPQSALTTERRPRSSTANLPSPRNARLIKRASFTGTLIYRPSHGGLRHTVIRPLNNEWPAVMLTTEPMASVITRSWEKSDLEIMRRFVGFLCVFC